MIQAAGILMTAPTGRALFLRRSDSGVWATPGGHIEHGETPWEAAKREIFEETKYSGLFFTPTIAIHHRNKKTDFVLFSAKVPYEFLPRLDYEHTDYMWASVRKPPEPLHWGLRWLRKKES